MSGSESTGTQYQSTPRTIKGQVGGLSHLIPNQLADEARIAAIVLKSKGISVGIAAGAGIVALALLGLMVIALVVALIMGIGTVIDPWLAALLVAAGFLVLALIFAAFAFFKIKKSMPLVPEEAIRGIRHDLGVVKDGSAFDVSTLDEPKPSKKKDEKDAKKDDAHEAKAEKPTHNELIIRTRERREEIALHRDGLGQKLEAPLHLGEKFSDAGQAAGDAVTKAAGKARHLADTASEKFSEGAERATGKLASLSGLEGDNAKEALRERWRPLAIMAGSVTMFFVFLRKLVRK
ncbi:phage holin family protein [Paeniglutamicibacter sp. ABSL32-1]|uniref:phage holin family protein n=1 Tax=Paeniglutamicibacter quisquiliarum TaxID=2849498 RepID=UPI001C2DCB20|nr:phage holin family protein [Paeniglutamicibacter quisquiliarum]MBV1780169.1 phage holin family protein [Paeniglutamicibacter quisquiliarum]